ncbi:MAG: PglZ domain-containing protein [Firmicutes bacterium]|jgi:hypothetical protein|nr:PglZ domain-containing protein [Bacillota bacterium]
MGKVTEYLINLVAEQVRQNRLVVWFDPEHHYADVVAGLELPDTTIARYGGSFFGLRREIDALLEGEGPPQLIVYVPMAEEGSNDALVELTAAGVVMKPGQNPWQRNTRLSVVARGALKSVLGEATTAQLEKQVEAGQLSLNDLDRLADDRSGKGIITILFGTVDPVQVALSFLAAEPGSALLRQVEERNALGDLASFLGEAFEVELIPDQGMGACRARLARHVLFTAFAADVREELPPELVAVPRARGERARLACQAVAGTWRSRSDLRASYVQSSRRVEEELQLHDAPFSVEHLLGTEVFLAAERMLQGLVEGQLLSGVDSRLIGTARSRRAGFWAEQTPEVQARWELIAEIGSLLAEAARVQSEMKTTDAQAADVVRRYAAGDSPWCLLDTHHRRMERLYQDLNFAAGEPLDTLEKLVYQARRRYVETSDDLARRFVTALRDCGFKTGGILRQVDVFGSRVAQLVEQGRVAYVLVDAFRYEMARELATSLSQGFEVEIEPALAAVPTITEIGMAALMPRADLGAAIVPAEKGRLALKVAGAVLKDRPSRVRFFCETAGVPAFEAKLEDLIPRPGKKAREAIERSSVVLVTSQEIDEICESGNVLLARRVMEDIPHLVHKACHVLADLGVENMVIAADHGYLFGEVMDSDMKIEPPGGETLDLHRRAWVGRGGSFSSAFVRARVEDFGLGDGDLEIAVPVGLGVFRVPGGSLAYFHGGLSLQEAVIPVIRVKPKGRRPAGIEGDVKWRLVPGSKKITTRFFSVHVQGQVATLLEASLPRVRLEVRAGKEVLSTPVSASYGFEDATRSVEMRTMSDDAYKVEPNTVTLMLNKVPAQKTVAVHMTDAASGRELARLEDVEVAIAI